MIDFGCIRFVESWGRFEKGAEAPVQRFGATREGFQYWLMNGEVVPVGPHVVYEGLCETCGRWTDKPFFDGCATPNCPHGYQPCL